LAAYVNNVINGRRNVSHARRGAEIAAFHFLEEVETTPWVVNPVLSSPLPHSTIFPFRSEDLGIKQLLSLQRTIASGSFVNLVDFAHADPSDKDALAQKKPTTVVEVATLARPGEITTTAEFVSLFGRYMKAMAVVHREQYGPMARYLTFIGPCIVQFSVKVVLAYDAQHRAQVASSGESIASPQALTALWFRMQSAAPQKGPRLEVPQPRPGAGGDPIRRIAKRPKAGALPLATPNGNTPPVKVCWPFNAVGGCQRPECQFAHVCRKCGASDHAATVCKQA
jgi:hypothetical protein